MPQRRIRASLPCLIGYSPISGGQTLAGPALTSGSSAPPRKRQIPLGSALAKLRCRLSCLVVNYYFGATHRPVRENPARAVWYFLIICSCHGSHQVLLPATALRPSRPPHSLTAACAVQNLRRTPASVNQSPITDGDATDAPYLPFMASSKALESASPVVLE